MESAGINHLHRTLPYGLISPKEGRRLKSQKESWETVEPKYDFGRVFSCLDVNCLANLQIARLPESANQLRRENSESHLGDSYVVCTPMKTLGTVFMAPKISWMF